MGLQPLSVVYSFSAGIDFRRQMTSKIVSRAELFVVFSECFVCYLVADVCTHS